MQCVIIYLLVGAILALGLISLYIFEQKNKQLWEREFGERAFMPFVILGVVVTFCWLPTLLLIGIFGFKGRDENGKRG